MFDTDKKSGKAVPVFRFDGWDFVPTDTEEPKEADERESVEAKRAR